MKINDKLTIANFGAVTELIADAYFDQNGDFVPHYGLITAMRLFYDYCVTESAFDEVCPRGTNDIEKLDLVFADDEFTREFNKSITQDAPYEELSFGNAHAYAMDIVYHRKSGAATVVNVLRSVADELAERMIPLLNAENMKGLTKAISGEVDAGSPDAALAGILKQYETVAGKIDGETEKVVKKKKPAKVER